MTFLINRNACPDTPYTETERAVISEESAKAARDTIGLCPAHAATPLHVLSKAAADLNVGAVYLKDEGPRFGLNAFKSLGGAYAVAMILSRSLSERLGKPVSVTDLARGTYAEHTRGVTVACASSGNHGRAVAAGARHFGCAAVIYVPGDTVQSRIDAIEGEGARVVRHPGTYDEAVRDVEETARAEGWVVISDTSWPGYEDIPKTVMTGYTVMAAEALEQMAALGAPPPTHVIIQGGVGGVAAATCAQLTQALPDAVPTIVVAEPEAAACVLASLEAGEPRPATGDLETIVGPLNCREVAAVAWPILKNRLTAAITVTDPEILAAIADLKAGTPSVATGPAGAAGFAAAKQAAAAADIRAALGLTAESVVLLFGTEGAVAGIGDA